MVQPFSRVLILSVVISCCAAIASANVIPVGLLTFDAGTPYALAAFDITNLTGADAFPPDFPITTQLTITVTSLVADLQGGGTLTINGGDFSVVDPQGDLNCTVVGDAGSGGCDFSAYNLVSATLSGTLSPVTGLTGLPAGATGIADSFTATIAPNAGCGPGGSTATTLTAACDVAVINATTVPQTVPEPSSLTLLGIAMVGLLASYKFRGSGEVS